MGSPQSGAGSSALAAGGRQKVGTQGGRWSRWRRERVDSPMMALVIRGGPAAGSRDGEEMRGAERWDTAVGGPDQCNTVAGHSRPLSHTEGVTVLQRQPAV